MEHIKDKLSWMNVAGVALIIYAGASFLLEGWNNLTDLTKYLTYFAFSFLIYLLAEVFKNNQHDKILSKILWILSSITSLAIIFQAASFLIDKYNPIEAKHVGNFLTPQNSILVLSSISFAYYTLVKVRVSKYLFGKIDPVFLLIMILNAILILIPFRNYYYHMTSLVVMSLYTIIYIVFTNLKNEITLDRFFLCIVPVSVLAVRIYLYEQFDANYTLILSFIGLILSIIIERQNNYDSEFLKSSNVFFAIVSLCYLSENLNYGTEISKFTFFTIAFNLLFLIFRNRLLFAIILSFINFSYAFNFTIQIEHHSLVEIVLIVATAIAFVINGYLVRNKMRFMAYSAISIMLLIGLVANSLENIQVNQSIVIATIGLGLLMVRFVFANPKNKIMEIISSVKERFEDKNKSSLS